MVRIDATGSVIKDDDDGSSSGGSGEGGGGRRRCRLPAYVDTFGFHLELKHFAVVLLFVSLTMGSFGIALFLLSLTIYHFYQRRASSVSSSGGGSARWKDGKVVGRNIKGVSDLPKPKQG